MPKISERQRINLERLLLGEEKIIVKTLTEIKQQRNRLAIERLEIESRLSASINKQLRNQETAPKPTEVVQAPSTSVALSTSFAALSTSSEALSTSSEALSTSFEALSTSSEALSTSSGASKQAAPPEKHIVVTTMSQPDMPVAGIDDTMCNIEELDLSITSVCTKEQIAAYETEEDEEDSQQSEDYNDDVIDMDTSLYISSTPKA